MTILFRCLAILCFTFALPNAVSAQPAQEDEQQSPDLGFLSHISAMNTGGSSIAGAGGKAATIVPDLFTGTVSATLPLKVPSGRSAMAPAIDIQYRSSNGNGWLGVGWNIEAGAIRRNNRFGVNFSNEDFTFVTSTGTTEIVEVSTNNFSSRLEATFTRFSKHSNADGPFWIAIDKGGKEYVFGSSPLGKLRDPSSPLNVVEWRLETITDPHGNQILFDYILIDSYPYLKRVSFSGRRTNDLPPNHFIEFELIDRSDRDLSFNLGFPLTISKRLKEVTVCAGVGDARTTPTCPADKIYRRYRLTYWDETGAIDATAPVQFIKRSAITQIEEIGSRGSTLPASKFEYDGSGFGFKAQSILASPANVWNSSQGRWDASWHTVNYPDVDGDGVPDLCAVEASNLVCRRGSGSSFLDWFSIPVSQMPSSFPVYADVNGDGKSDLCGRSAYGISCRLSSESGFVKEIAGPQWTDGAGWNDEMYGTTIRFPDLNADGMADVCGRGGAGIVCHLSLGNVFDSAVINGPAWTDASGWNQKQYYSTIQYPDLNNDGRADICARDFAGIVCYLNTGAQFDLNNPIRGPAWKDLAGIPVEGFLTVLNTETAWQRDEHRLTIQFPDINGDGLPDVCARSRRGIECHIGTGKGFLSSVVQGPFWANSNEPTSRPGVPAPAAFLIDTDATPWEQTVHRFNPNGVRYYSTIRFADINGDGRADVCGRRRDGVFCYLSSAGGFSGKVAGPALNDAGFREDRRGLTLSFRDIDADGTADICALTDTGVQCWSNSVGGRYRLSKISNGIGGSTVLSYAHNTAGFGPLPIPVQVLASVTVDDGTGIASTTSYKYDGGRLYIPARDFRGFNKVETRQPDENGIGRRFITWFHQGNDFTPDQQQPLVAVGRTKGKWYRRELRDFNDVLYQRSFAWYKHGSDAGPSFFDPLTKVESSLCSTTQCDQTTRFVYEHDRYGNIVREERHGDVADFSDDYVVERTYLDPVGLEILNRVETETVFEGIALQKKAFTKKYSYGGIITCGQTTSSVSKAKITSTTAEPVNGAKTEVSFSYDDFGNIACSKDERGNPTEMRYDSTRSFIVDVVNALGHKASTRYYGVDGTAIGPTGYYGQEAVQVDFSGSETVTYFDDLGRSTSTEYPDGSFLRTDYSGANTGNPAAQYIETERPYGIKARYFFDGLGRGRKTEGTGPAGTRFEIQTEFDRRGYMIKRSDPAKVGDVPVWTTLSYDSVGRILKVVRPDGGALENCYDGAISVKMNETGKLQRFVRNGTGKVVEVSDYLGSAVSCSTALPSGYASVHYRYDPFGRVVEISDSRTNPIIVKYDENGRRKEVRDQNLGTWTYSYDQTGNLVQQVDGRGKSTFLNYDRIGRVQQKDFGTKKALGRGDVRYIYDNADRPNATGRLATVFDEHGKTDFWYDLVGRQSVVERTVHGRKMSRAVAHDKLGRLLAVTYPDGHTIQYKYDQTTLEKVFDDNQVFASYADYTLRGQPRRISLGNGLEHNYEYSDDTARGCGYLRSHLCEMTIYQPSRVTPIYRRAYTFEQSGNLTSVTDEAGTIRNFEYDELARLKRSQKASSAVTYEYDELGNITRNAHDERITYSKSRPHAIQNFSRREFSYDSNGNLSSDGKRTFKFDIANRMDEVRTGEKIFTIDYDGDGGVAAVKVNGKATRYFGDMYECTGSDCTKHIFAGRARIASLNTRNVYYFHHDHLGSVLAITDKGGNEVRSISYEPFGSPTERATSAKDAPSTNFRFTGQRYYSEVLLYRLGSRFYDPILGRFISPDPIIPEAGNSQALNRYAYALNNPLRYDDPSGNCPICVAAIIGGLIAGGMAAANGGDWDDIGRAFLVGAVTGAIFAGVPAGNLAGMTFAGAWTGGFAAIVYGTDPGQGMLTGAVFGFLSGYMAANYSSFVPDFQVLDTATLGAPAVFVNQFVNDFITGAALGAAFSGVQGEDILQGAVNAGWQRAAFNLAASAVGHVVGLIASKGHLPEIDRNAFVYRAQTEGDGEWGFTAGNVITVTDRTMSKYNFYLQRGAAPADFIESADLMQHEYGHILQYRYQGPAFLAVYGGSMIAAGATGHHPMRWNINEYYMTNGARSSEDFGSTGSAGTWGGFEWLQ